MAHDLEMQDEKKGLMDDFAEAESSSSSCDSHNSMPLEEAITYKESDITSQSMYARFRTNLGCGWRRRDSNIIWRRYGGLAAKIILPSFLHTSVLGMEKKQETLRPTAYLDGLRGVAALSVVFCHLSLDWFPISAKAGYRIGEGDSVLQLPWIRNIYCGRASVCIFFVISGYVLSAKSLQQIHAGADAKALHTLASSLFRRAMRLFLPIVASTLIAFVIIRYDYFVADPQLPTPANIYPPRFETLYEQTLHYLSSLLRLTNVYNPPLIDAPYAYPYDGHIWTIPVEYHGSILVFLIVLVTARVRSTLRPVIISANAIYNFSQGSWDVFLFLSGVFIADIHANLRLQTLSPKTYMIHKLLSTSIIKQTLIWSSFVFGTLALGCPEDLIEVDYPSMLYSHLHAWTPISYASREKGAAFWSSIGAVLVVTSMSFSSLLQRPFTTRFAQYLGYVSYAIYLLHGNVLYTFGTRMLRDRIESEFGGTEWSETYGEGTIRGGMDFHLLFLGVSVVCLVVVFWAGDLFTRFVDEPCVRFSAWTERRCLRVGI